MKLKICMLWVVANCLYANTLNYHPTSSKDMAQKTNCEIEIINNSALYATVYGTFDDGMPLTPFNIMPDNRSQYISLYYQGYCHPSMYLDIVDANGFHVYTKYTSVNSVIRLVPSEK